MNLISDSVLSVVAQGLLVTLIVQGMRAFGVPRVYEHPRMALVLVGALVVLVNFIVMRLSPDAQALLHELSPALDILLALAVASGIFGYAKMLTNALDKKSETDDASASPSQ